MKNRFRLSEVCLKSLSSTRLLPLALGSGVWACVSVEVTANASLPPAAVEQFNQTIGARVEAVTILGGDYGAAGGLYTFRGGTLADVSIAKIGGGGNVASPKPLGWGDVSWAPVLLGNLGHLSAVNTFQQGYLRGNEMKYDTLAAQVGAGSRFYFTERLSLAATASGIYGHVKNEFHPKNPIGEAVHDLASGTFVDWELDTWSVAPSVDGRYDWGLGRTRFEFSTHYTFFHTESFSGSSPVIHVGGNSSTWENKIDLDVPLSWRILGHELHTGGFFSRTEIFGNASTGLNEDHVYTANGRVVLDLLGHVWKVRWLGLGTSYFWGDHVNGWSAGMDIRFQF
jgi:hypothetical protein